MIEVHSIIRKLSGNLSEYINILGNHSLSNAILDLFFIKKSFISSITHGLFFVYTFIISHILENFANSKNKNIKEINIKIGINFEIIFIFQILNHFKSKEFSTTETLLNAMINHANSGLNKNPNLLKNHAAIGIHKIL
jgi:hypothetical protein